MSRCRPRRSASYLRRPGTSPGRRQTRWTFCAIRYLSRKRCGGGKDIIVDMFTDERWMVCKRECVSMRGNPQNVWIEVQLWRNQSLLFPGKTSNHTPTASLRIYFSNTHNTSRLRLCTAFRSRAEAPLDTSSLAALARYLTACFRRARWRCLLVSRRSCVRISCVVRGVDCADAYLYGRASLLHVLRPVGVLSAFSCRLLRSPGYVRAYAMLITW